MTNSSTAADRASGRCLCGAVQYHLSRAAVLTAGHCHCRDCQRITGSGKATIVFLPATALELRGELRSYSVTGSAGSRVERRFCPTCGTQLLSQVREQPGLVFIKAGTLDDADWVQPMASYWAASAAPWSSVDPTIPQFAHNPPAQATEDPMHV